jgi:hypothetical protein
VIANETGNSCANVNTQTAASEEAVSVRTHKQSARLVVVVTWLLVGILYGPMINQLIEMNTHDKQFVESLRDVVRIAAKERRSTNELRALVLVRAKELSIPVRAPEILIRGNTDKPRVTIYYDAGIIVPILNWPAYFFRFNHAV